MLLNIAMWVYAVQILMIQLADDVAESIGLLDVDLEADHDILPDYFAVPSIHVRFSCFLLT